MSKTEKALNLKGFIIYALIFISAFFVYSQTLNSSFYLDDSPETATVCHTLSIGHPPGYPLHTLCGRLAQLILPGSPALALNFFAAFLAAFNLAVLFGVFIAFNRRFLIHNRREMLCGIFMIAILGLSDQYWHNALSAKGSIYHLNNFFTITLIGIPLWLNGRRQSRLFGLFFGLALGHHYMSQLVVLPAYALLLWLINTPANRLQQLKQIILWTLPGLSVYSFLFLRADLNPPINWGNIQNLNDFLFFLFRTQYSGGEGTGSWTVISGQLKTAFSLLFKHSLWIGPLLIPGLLFFRKKAKQLPVLLLGMFIPVFAVAFYLRLTDERLYIMGPYLFPAYIFQTLAAATALTLGFQRLKPQLAQVLALILAAVFLQQRMPAWKLHDASSYYFGWDNAHNMLDSCPENTLLFSSGDSVIFPIWYLQQICGKRRDIALVGIPLLPMDWMRNDLKRHYPDIVLPEIHGKVGSESTNRIMNALLYYNQAARPTFLTYNKPGADFKAWKTRQNGMAYRMSPANQPDTADPDFCRTLLSTFRYRNYYSGTRDQRTEILIINDSAIHLNSLGTWYEDLNRHADALIQYREAMELAPKDEEFVYNTGNALYYLGRFPEAVTMYRKSLELNPEYTLAWFNLGVTFHNMGQYTQSRQAFDSLKRIDPNSPLLQK